MEPKSLRDFWVVFEPIQLPANNLSANVKMSSSLMDEAFS